MCIYLFIFAFWLLPEAYKMLVPQPGIEPKPPALEAQGLSHCETISGASEELQYHSPLCVRAEKHSVRAKW